MATAKDFLAALKAVRDTQAEQVVGTFKLFPDNRMGRGFSSEQQVMRHDPLRLEPSCLSPRLGGMRYWPDTDAGMLRIAKRYAADEAAEMANRAD
ncbi:hypothetical protein [Burkholderia gladioli]|uniref:hypothetical protein n=1 Tax=Burkholderia gladioli TaxID=28095 RepID=UPI0034DB1475